jgi:hypothetical protein
MLSESLSQSTALWTLPGQEINERHQQAVDGNQVLLLSDQVVKRPADSDIAPVVNFIPTNN